MDSRIHRFMDKCDLLCGLNDRRTYDSLICRCFDSLTHFIGARSRPISTSVSFFFRVRPIRVRPIRLRPIRLRPIRLRPISISANFDFGQFRFRPISISANFDFGQFRFQPISISANFDFGQFRLRPISTSANSTWIEELMSPSFNNSLIK